MIFSEVINILKNIQESIGAPSVPIAPIEVMITTGTGILSGEGVLFTPIGTFTNGKDNCIEYIYQQYKGYWDKRKKVESDGYSTYKYHLCICQTLEEYRIKKQHDDKFVTHAVKWGSKTWALVDGKRSEVKMHVCKNCLRKLNYKGYSYATEAEKESIYRNFDVSAFFKECTAYLPGTKHMSLCVPRNEYPIGWDRIASDFKRRIPYCEFCGDRQNLECHHIDGNKSNCGDRNLLVLCKSCHEKVHKYPMTMTAKELNTLELRQKGYFPN